MILIGLRIHNQYETDAIIKPDEANSNLKQYYPTDTRHQSEANNISTTIASVVTQLTQQFSTSYLRNQSAADKVITSEFVSKLNQFSTSLFRVKKKSFYELI